MNGHKRTLLVVDDEPFNLEIISEYLSGFDYKVITATNGYDALSLLKANPDEFDAVLLDRMMPGMNGIDVLIQIKQEDSLKILPVILQTAACSAEQIAEGLNYGAFYYLTKPFEQTVLHAVVETAIRDRMAHRELIDDLNSKVIGLQFIKTAEFSVSKPNEARSLAILLSGICPSPAVTCMGITEILLNAIEHGNLGITYNEKTDLLNENSLQAEIEKRLSLPIYASRKVKIEVVNTDSELRFTISDEGNGFEWREFIEMNIERLMHNHGRGIALSKSIAFTTLEYIGKGNCVVATVLKTPKKRL